MNILTANELKTRGISVVESHLKDEEEVIISVRGNNRYVVMEIQKYTRLREYELAGAIQEAKADVEAGRYTAESISEHMKQVAGEL